MIIPLSHISPGQSARIEFLGNEDHMARRLIDLGFAPGSPVSCVLQKPKKTIAAYLVRGAVIALREEDSRLIFVCPASSDGTQKIPVSSKSDSVCEATP